MMRRRIRSPMGRAWTPAVLLTAALLLAGCGADEPAPQPAGPPSPVEFSLARSTMYEVFVRNFSPGGTLRGVIDGLDRIEGAGAEIVWLMPIHPIGEIERKGPVGSPYSITDYRAINPDFGDEADFRDLVRAVHARGMKLILDWVPNHTAWDHVWVESNPEYYARDESRRMTVPRNEDGSLTDWTDVAELDYGNPDLRRAMIGAMLYWLDEFGIDGFRVDVAGFVPDDFWREALPQLRYAGATVLLAEWGDPRMHELGFDITYPWDSYHALKEVWRGGSAAEWVRGELDDVRRLPPGALRLRFTTNHDETSWDEPPVTLFGNADGARAAFVAMALMPGVPLIYNGQEIESPQRFNLFVREPVEWDRTGAGQARAFYRRVLDLARTHTAFAGDAFEPVEIDAADDVIAYRRGDAVVLVNARPRPVTVQTDWLDLDDAVDLLGVVGFESLAADRDAITLPPYGAAVLEPARAAAFARR